MALSPPTVLLSAEGVSRRAPGGNAWLLRAVSLEVRAGERLGLSGPSGSGKTLLLRALALLDPLDGGEVRWKGNPVASGDVPAFRRHVVYLHQRPALFDGNAEDNLRLPFALCSSRGSRFDAGRVTGWLRELGRGEDFLAKSSRDLSGGEAQILGVLRALQLDPEVLLLDEPTAALDPGATGRVEELLLRWQDADPGRAFVWVSHDAEQVGRVTRRHVAMSGGRIEDEAGA